MAGRIRSIRPELIAHKGFAKLSDAAARIFYGLYSIVDDTGRCPAEPSYIAGQILWGRPRSNAAIGRLLVELESGGWIRRYTVEDVREPGDYLEIQGWFDKRAPTYQLINRPQRPKFPAPIADDSVNDSETDLDPDLDHEHEVEENATGIVVTPEAAPPTTIEMMAKSDADTRVSDLGTNERRQWLRADTKAAGIDLNLQPLEEREGVA